MSVSYDSGAAVEAVISKLQDGMPAQLDILDAEYNDFTLPNIDRWYRARLGDYDAYPCQVVIPFGQGRIGDGSDSNQDASFNIWTHPLVVVTLDVSSIEAATVSGQALLPVELMQKRLGRYVRATVELLDADRDLTIPNASLGGAILEIGSPNWLDFEYNLGDPSILRRSVAIQIDVAVQ